MSSSLGARVVLRGLRGGDGVHLAGCWKELWDLHESWGGYATDRTPEAFTRVADRLERDASERGGEIAYGRHLHVVAELDGRAVGQVEGWLDKLGSHERTKTVCEIRSLIVDTPARNLGLARKLLERLAEEAERVVRERCVAIAEVLEANPAMTFYEGLGFRPVAYTRRLVARDLLEVERLAEGLPGERTLVRRSRAGDEQAVAHLEARLAERRVRLGDARFDPPHAIEAAWLGVLRGMLATEDSVGGQSIVAATPEGGVRATSLFFTQELEPPFAPQARAIVSRLESFDDEEAYAAAQLLVRGLSRLARRANVSAMEIIDLPPPSASLSRALEAIGIRPWSRIMQRA